MTTRRTYYRYTVQGTWRFPFDMLRYDRATPDTEADAGEIERSTRVLVQGDPDKIKPFSVTLRAESLTIGRWASFGWKVTSAVEITETPGGTRSRPVLP